MKFVDITNDIAFRKIFGNENKKNALISFLNAVITLPNENKIIDVDILNPYQLPKLNEGKSTILDVKAKDKNGNTFIVEMQVAENVFFHKRVLFYTSQSYIAQINKGQDYSQLKPVYFIGILEFNIGQNKPYLSCNQVLNVETQEQVFQDIEFNLIELPKFNKKIEDLNTPIDQWVYFIKNAENLDIIPENIVDEGLKEAYQEAAKHNWTPSELENYERASIKSGDEKNQLETAEKKGEHKSKIAMAQLMKIENEPIEKIMKYTELTKEEIEKIQ